MYLSFLENVIKTLKIGLQRGKPITCWIKNIIIKVTFILYICCANPDIWSEWGQFSACDKTCGGGIQIRHRLCGSGTCFGDSLESAACNDHQCPGNTNPIFLTFQPNFVNESFIYVLSMYVKNDIYINNFRTD